MNKLIFYKLDNKGGSKVHELNDGIAFLSYDEQTDPDGNFKSMTIKYLERGSDLGPENKLPTKLITSKFEVKIQT